MTFYLKYRPSSINQLDLEAVRERLSSVVEKGKYSHAYLFFGPKGTGKTSAARILAGKAGVALSDVIEMDAASNRGIDDIRELRERVGLVPSSGDKKAYIIDEVHMLTSEAFNALLKTLEEPPPHVIFFLCTTAAEKLPETVISRCVKISFSKATTKEIIRSLKRIVKSEKLKIDDQGLEMIARSTDGSFREAHTILEEAASVAGRKKITSLVLEKIIGQSLGEKVKSYVDGVINGQSQESLEAVAQVVAQGGNIENFARQILNDLRHRLITSSDPRILKVVKIVEKRIRTVKFSPLPQLPLEIAALELAVKIGESPPKKNNDFGQKQTVNKNDQQNSSRLTITDFTRYWPMILKGVKQNNHGIVTLLAHCRPVAVTGNLATVEVKFKFHKEQLEQDKFRRLIEGVVGQVCGLPLRLRFRLSPPTQKALKNNPLDDNISTVADDELFKAAEDLFS